MKIKTSLYHYFKESWGIASLGLFAIYAIMILASIFDYFRRGEIAGFLLLGILFLIIGTIIAFDYFKWRKNKKIGAKSILDEEVRFKGTTYNPPR